MLHRKKFLIILSLIVIVGLFSACEALGLQTAWPPAPGGLELTDDSTLLEFVDYCYRWGITFGGLAAFIALVLGGFKYLTSTGDPNKLKDARDWIFSALLGLGVLLSSFIILNTLNPDLTNLTVPSVNIAGFDVEEWGVPDLSKPCEVTLIFLDKDFKGDYIIFRDISGPPPDPAILPNYPSLGTVNLEDCYDNTTGWWIWTGQAVNFRSVKMVGACRLNLYKDAGCSGSFEAITSNQNNLDWLSLEHVYSLKVTDISAPLSPIVETVGGSNSGSNNTVRLTGNITNMNKNPEVGVWIQYGTSPDNLGSTWPRESEDRLKIYKINNPFTYEISDNDFLDSFTKESESATYGKELIASDWYWRTVAFAPGAGVSFGSISTFNCCPATLGGSCLNVPGLPGWSEISQFRCKDF